MFRSFCIALGLLLSGLLPLESAAAASQASRPRIGLVLGGGGARGFAHLGVLAELERLRIPVDCMSGASAGALIGGFYASGVPLPDLRRAFAGADWNDMLSGRVARADVPYARKRDDYTNYFDFRLGVRNGEMRFPKGAISSQKIDLFIRKLARDIRMERFADLPIPFEAMATDLVTGEPVVFDHGDLALAQRASMAVPGAFDPVPYEDTLLVDGGLARQLPIENLKNRCADVLIVVDVGTRPLGAAQISTVFDVLSQTTNIGILQNVRQQSAYLDLRDIVIRPELGQLGSTDFDKSVELDRLGQQAVRAHASQLKPFSVSEEEYRDWQRRFERNYPQPAIARIDIGKTDIVNPEVLRRQIDVAVGQPLDQAKLHRNLQEIFASGDYDKLDYRLEDGADGTVLKIEPEERTFAPNYLRTGLNLAGDTGGSADFNLLFGHTRVWANRYGAEWRNDLSLGRHAGYKTEFYQPLGADSRWFAAIGGSLDKDYMRLYDLAGHRLSEYDINTNAVTAELGASLGTYGEIRTGLIRGERRADLAIGSENILPTTSQQLGGVIARVQIDQFDNPKLPRSGYMAQANAYQGLTAVGADRDFTALHSRLDWAGTFGRDTVRTTVRFETTSSSNVADNLSTLGGFLNLTGFQQKQLVGQRTAFGRLMGYRQIASLPAALGGGFYLGGSLELGRVWNSPVSDINSYGWIPAGSLFAVADSLLGPLFIGAGYARGGQLTGYMYLGLDY